MKQAKMHKTKQNEKKKAANSKNIFLM